MTVGLWRERLRRLTGGSVTAWMEVVTFLVLHPIVIRLDDIIKDAASSFTLVIFIGGCP